MKSVLLLFWFAKITVDGANKTKNLIAFVRARNAWVKTNFTWIWTIVVKWGCLSLKKGQSTLEMLCKILAKSKFLWNFFPLMNHHAKFQLYSVNVDE